MAHIPGIKSIYACWTMATGHKGYPDVLTGILQGVNRSKHTTETRNLYVLFEDNILEMICFQKGEYQFSDRTDLNKPVEEGRYGRPSRKVSGSRRRIDVEKMLESGNVEGNPYVVA